MRSRRQTGERRAQVWTARTGCSEVCEWCGNAEDAEDALDRYIQSNSSSIHGYVLLADVREKLGRKDEAKQAIAEALDIWKKLPTFRKKGQWPWWLRAWFEKLLG